MVDFVSIKVKAGDGGKGHASFRRVRGKKYGPPTGGDGGDGGNVFIRASSNLSTLIPYRYRKDFKAMDGVVGGKDERKGARGQDLVLEVPLGTVVKEESGFNIADLIKEGQQELIALGGKRGKGNVHIQAPVSLAQKDASVDKYEHLRHAEPGGPGEEVELTLELKLLADVGLVGLPNAGKSTLLSKLTSAKPKISSHPFTTLEPNLGVMFHKGKEAVIADIPGLIEGASKGKGLGDQFLRHIERTKVLVHLISAQSHNPFADMVVIKNELSQYSKELPQKTVSLNDKPEIAVLTKIDIVSDEELKNKVDQFKKYNIKVIPISADAGIGIDGVKDKIIELISKL